MNLINHSSKFFFAIFLMMNLSNTYATTYATKIQAVDAEIQESAGDTMEAAGAEAVEASEGETACRAEEACDVASAVSEDEMYGGIQQEYVVKGCKVTIYNDGPVKMVNIKTDQPCDAPLPRDHKFSR